MALKYVWEPLKIGSVELKNRVARAASSTSGSPDAINDDWIAYHRARARGGVGLTILEAGAVHPNSQTAYLIDDRAMVGFGKLMDAVRPFGMRVFQQLHHAGHHIGGMGGQMPWSASATPSPMSGIVGVPMGKADIDELIAAFAEAARKCRDAGLDGVEVHSGHGYIFQQFLSPLTNRREDSYNGGLLERARFLTETLSAIRKAVGPDFPVGARLGASLAKGGTTVADIATLAKHLVAERLVDFVDLTYSDFFKMSAICSTMGSPSGYELPANAVIGEGIKVPRLVTGRFRTLEEAEQVLREGKADLVSMVRAHIADPDIVRKTREGRVEEIRPCIACNQGCLGGLIQTGRSQCAINPAAGFESTLDESLLVKSDRPKTVLVIGGGPGGLEAARVAALRGHRVILAEALPTLGGALQVAKRAPSLHILGDLVSWLEQRVYALGVDVRLGSYMEASDVMAEKPDVLIVATGSSPTQDGRQAVIPGELPEGMQLPHVYDPISMITGPATDFKGKAAVVFDDVGRYEAVAAAEFLQAAGVSSLTFITHWGCFAPKMVGTLRDVEAFDRLNRGPFRLLVNNHLVAVEPDAVTVRTVGTQRLERITADVAVVVTSQIPERTLFDELRGVVGEAHLIGNALSPRDLMSAIREGHRCARSVD